MATLVMEAMAASTARATTLLIANIATRTRRHTAPLTAATLTRRVARITVPLIRAMDSTQATAAAIRATVAAVITAVV